jgi:hypothetical protein
MKQFSSIIIGVLVALLLFREMGGCKGTSGNPSKSDTVVVHDTTWQKFDSIVVKKVPVKSVIHDTLPPEYLPNPMYDSLKVQYEELAKEFLAKKIYADTLKVPQIKGLFIVNDTIKNNELLGRSWTADYILPTVKETITITKQAPQKRQLYVGGGLSANKTNIAQAQAGLMYKDRRDRMFGAYVGFDPAGQMSVGIQSYWKITLKK